MCCTPYILYIEHCNHIQFIKGNLFCRRDCIKFVFLNSLSLIDTDIWNNLDIREGKPLVFTRTQNPSPNHSKAELPIPNDFDNYSVVAVFATSPPVKEVQH